MYTILMNDDKSLVTSIKTTLYQREENVDKIQFLLPQKYEPKNLIIKNCIVVLKYVDQANVPHAKQLVIDDELYKDRVRGAIDVDIELTRFAGNIKCHLDFLKLNTDPGLYESVLSSGETVITIQPLDDYFAYIPNGNLDIINQSILSAEAKIKALEAIATTYDSEKADNISLDDESIYLTSHGNKIGNEIPLNTLGDAISDATDEGLVRVITEDEITVPDGTGDSITYSLQLDQETDELYLLKNGEIISTIKTKDIGESIIDSTDESLNEVIT